VSPPIYWQYIGQYPIFRPEANTNILPHIEERPVSSIFPQDTTFSAKNVNLHLAKEESTLQAKPGSSSPSSPGPAPSFPVEFGAVLSELRIIDDSAPPKGLACLLPGLPRGGRPPGVGPPSFGAGRAQVGGAPSKCVCWTRSRRPLGP
jgi:hypothetical protein